MTFWTLMRDGVPTIVWIALAMAAIATVEAWKPLRAFAAGRSARALPNLVLTVIAFATNAVLGSALSLALLEVEARGGGLLRMVELPRWAIALSVIVALDLAFYVAHVAMHHMPLLWSFHRVHHSDAEVDVTTTIRQHPGESLIRYAFIATVAIAIGAPAGAFALYRAISALNGLLAHANVRVPARLDSWLSQLFSTPNFHKVHHSRLAHETNTNYGNILALFDRLLGTYVPSERGTHIAYGLDGLDDPAQQTTAGLLAMPWSVFRTRGTSCVDAAVAQRRGRDGAS
jgi:sterol desaturase/sphingolipid hydroxylase (fatty acid hydroxylase superfamily)